VGVWDFVSVRTRWPDGHVTDPWGETPVGRLTYEADSGMITLLMDARRNQANGRAVPVEVQASVAAYYGTYSVDPVRHVVTHHVATSLRASEAGSIERHYTLSGDTLVLTAKCPVRGCGRDTHTRLAPRHRRSRKMTGSLIAQRPTECDVPDALRSACVPAFVLQLLVENAIRHGLAPRRAPGRVLIAARLDGDRLSLCVSDDGDGFGAPSGDSSLGIGLQNVRARLAQLHGSRGTLTIEPSKPHGTVATIHIPYRVCPSAETPSPAYA
jgi:hypothetical protein